jgi:catechol 2,3-dioxygenase-like lactoylglutathione lyase family enzyme
MTFSIGFNHVAIVTPDLDRLVAFYGDVFGGKKVFEMAEEEGHPRMAVVTMGGGAALNIFESPAESIIGERRTPGARGAIDHFAVAVESLDALETARERLTAAGADIGEIQMLGDEWSLFFRDPDGMELEVCATSTADERARVNSGAAESSA